MDLEKRNRNAEIIAVLLLLALGTVLRFVWLDSLPMGLNQDEASAGYDAWALLNYGTDRNGYALPVLLRSWGSGQNVLYSYLSMPFIALFGLSEFSLRLTAAVCGTLSLPVFWMLARRCRGRFFGLCALFLLAVNPWHIMASRWALESNLLPLFLLVGVYFTVLGRERQYMLVPAALAFGLSLYAYGTAFMFLALYLPAAVIWLHRAKAVRNAGFLGAMCVFAVLAFPITLCQIRNALALGDGNLFGLSLPALSEVRQLTTTVFRSGGLSQAADNYKSFLKLLWLQTDGLTYNAIPGHGLYYLFGLPLAVIGLVSALVSRRDWPRELPVLIWLGVSFALSPLISVNINRMNMAMLPMIYFSALGFYAIMRRCRGFEAIPIALVLFCLTLFLGSYVYQFRTQPSANYFPGLGEALEYADSLNPETLYVTNMVNQPYIFVLFYLRIAPGEYLNSVEYINPGGTFENVSRFSRYRFGSLLEAEGDLLILHKTESYGYEVLEQFGSFTVCKALVSGLELSEGNGEST